jgi:hypothetical protein
MQIENQKEQSFLQNFKKNIKTKKLTIFEKNL